MVLDTKDSQFLDKIKRACEQFKIDSCQMFAENFSINKIEQDIADAIGIIDKKCITNSRTFLDKMWQHIFPLIDSIFERRYDEHKRSNWDNIEEQLEQNKIFLNSKFNLFKAHINNSDNTEKFSVKFEKDLEDIKKILPRDIHNILDHLTSADKLDTKILDEIQNQFNTKNEEIYIERAKMLRKYYIEDQYSNFIAQLSAPIEKHIKSACHIKPNMKPANILGENEIKAVDTIANIIVDNDI